MTLMSCPVLQFFEVTYTNFATVYHVHCTLYNLHVSCDKWSFSVQCPGSLLNVLAQILL
jgi:hypothetical protein